MVLESLLFYLLHRVCYKSEKTSEKSGNFKMHSQNVRNTPKLFINQEKYFLDLSENQPVMYLSPLLWLCALNWRNAKCSKFKKKKKKVTRQSIVSVFMEKKIVVLVNKRDKTFVKKILWKEKKTNRIFLKHSL